MKVTKYRVVDPRITWINDVDAKYSGADDILQGVIQKLSATYNEYLLEEYAIPESWDKSLRSGLLRKFIDNGMIKMEVIEEKDDSNGIDPIYANPYNQKPIKEIENETKKTIDWNSLTLEEKRKMLENEEEIEKSEITRKIVKENKIKNLKTKKVKKTKVKNVIKKIDVENNKEKINAIANNATADNRVENKLDSFNNLKYQQKLQFISTCDDIKLLDEIISSDNTDMILIRAMKRRKLLSK
jgi:hypothetical protein